MNKITKLIILSLVFTMIASFNAQKIHAQDFSMLEWDGLDDPLFFPNYIKKNGGAPKIKIFQDEEIAFKIVKENPDAYLTANICSYNIDNWLNADLIKPWNKLKLENWNQIIPTFRDQQSLKQDGQIYMVPNYFTYTLMIYKVGTNKKYLQSLNSFIDPALKGQIGIIADGYYTPISLALMAVGVKDVANINETDWQKATDFLKKLKANGVNIYPTSNELADAMVDKNIKIAWAFIDTAIRATSLGYETKFNFQVQEGASSYVCGHFLINNKNPNNERAYDYINATSHQNVSSYLINYWGWGHANKVGLSKISKIDLLEYGLDDFDNRLKTSFFQKPVSQEWRNKFEAAYQEFIK